MKKTEGTPCVIERWNAGEPHPTERQYQIMNLINGNVREKVVVLEQINHQVVNKVINTYKMIK